MHQLNRIRKIMHDADIAYDNFMDLYQHPFTMLFPYEIDFWRNNFLSCFHALQDSAKCFDNDTLHSKFISLTHKYNRLIKIKYTIYALLPELTEKTLF